VPLQPDQIFPRQGSHDRIPDLINEIGKFVAADGDAAGSSFMIAEARQLGTLRHEQHASVHQLFHEYDLLRGILDAFTLEESREVHTAPAADVIGAMRRIDQAISLLTRVTVDTFVEACAQTMHEQAKTLEQFNRLVSHELRQPLTALQAAAPLLRNGRDGARRERVVGANRAQCGAVGRARQHHYQGCGRTNQRQARRMATRLVDGRRDGSGPPASRNCGRPPRADAHRAPHAGSRRRYGVSRADADQPALECDQVQRPEQVEAVR
jgi:signal transduction histidine kinase